MEITKIEAMQRKYGVFVEDQFVFSLYGKELKKFEIKEFAQIDAETIDSIRKETTQKRGLQYIYHLISSKDYTVKEIEGKLKKAGYDEVDTHVIVDKIMDMRLLDDAHYAKRYIEQKSAQKSRQQIVYALGLKGISRDIVQALYSETGSDDTAVLDKLIRKRLKGRTEIPIDEKNRLYNSLLRKGFQYTSIQKSIDQLGIRWLY